MPIRLLVPGLVSFWWWSNEGEENESMEEDPVLASFAPQSDPQVLFAVFVGRDQSAARAAPP